MWDGISSTGLARSNKLLEPVVWILSITASNLILNVTGADIVSLEESLGFESMSRIRARSFSCHCSMINELANELMNAC